MNATTKPITITYQPCESSQVAAWGYHAESKTLGVKFHGKALNSPPSEYHYFDVPQEVATAMGKAESLGKFIGSHVRGKFVYERQPDEATGIVYGLSQKQEPKYTTSRLHGRIVNRSSGDPIPDDEPVMIFRAQDRHARLAIAAYLSLVNNPDHAAVVKSRLLDFDAFALAHPDRMKEPDSSLQDVAVANVGRAPFTAA
jgi:hypothetical protein